jgi:hypothetical protein
LLLCLEPVGKFSVLITSNDHMFWGRNQAMLYSTIAAYLVLVSPSVEKSNI